jgi:sortase A
MTDRELEAWPERADPFEPDRSGRRREVFPKRIVATLAFLVGCLPRRRSGRRALGILTVLMAFAGVALLAYPFATDFWAKTRQNTLKKEITTQQAVQAYQRHEVKVGAALTKLIVPKFGGCPSCKKVDVVVVEGTTGNALRAGAGHYMNTPLPGELGNVAIAGHRTGFGEPFRHFDKLRQGDQVILQTPVGRYTYEVIGPFDGHKNPWVTHPRDLSVIQATPDAVLTLTTCDPPHTSKNRLIVRAKMIKTEPAR